MPLIAISGSQGTGKTTLIDALPYEKITRKTSRSILSEWGVTLSQVNNDRPLTIKFQDEILQRKIEDEWEATESDQVFITERTYADLFVYALVAIGKDNEYSDWLDDYYDRCALAQKRYGWVLYLTGGHFRPVYDGVRGVNEHYSWMVDTCMLEYTRRMSDGDVSIIDTPSLTDRIERVTGFCDRYQHINKV
jgi:AAA domain